MDDTAKDQIKPRNSGAGEAQNGQSKCECIPYKPKNDPGKDQPIRRLIKALEEELASYSQTPTEATKKFADDLKDCDKEYQGLADIVKKYEEAYEKLDCMLTEANKNKQDLREWCDEKGGNENIDELWEEEYEKKEHDICCRWIEFREKFNSLHDCPWQSDKTAEELKEDFEAFKNFEKTVKDRLTELKSLHAKAEELRAKERHNSVCAILIEYCELLLNLGVVQTWAYRREECAAKAQAPSQGASSEQGTEQSTADPCQEWTPETFLDKWTPEWLKEKLKAALRDLILGKYDRFRRYQYWLQTESEMKKWKEECEKFRKSRREEFIQEAEDVPEPAPEPTPTPTQQSPGQSTQQSAEQSTQPYPQKPTQQSGQKPTQQAAQPARGTAA